MTIIIYRVAVFDIENRDNTLQLVTKEPVDKKQAETIKMNIESTLDKSKEYADIIGSEF